MIYPHYTKGRHSLQEREEEKWLGQHFLAETGSPLVFVTHYPSVKRPFYAMDDPENPRYTLSYDLLLHGLEITTGGQRIHDLNMLEEKIQAKGMTEEGLEQYLDAFRFGMPPHGGLGIGLERLTMQLLGCESLRDVIAYPKVQNASELMTMCPAPVDQKALDDLGLAVTVKEKE